MKHTPIKAYRRSRRQGRIRAKVSGTSTRPRLAVFRSNRAVYAQLIDDVSGTTLVSADSRAINAASRSECATAVGKRIAEEAKEKGISTVVFDRGGFRYQGIVAALADGARDNGLTF